MAKNTSFSLGDHYLEFIEAEVGSGRYGTATDVVRSALRLLEDRETKLRAVREALIEAEDAGPSLPFDGEEFLARKRAESGRR
ncbi:type II toxin-antitoxin system ParD family antitoxin [Nocardia sp. NBC_01388]|uniref:type II toxin-antitoxin system ParD family antitoxin n=1 Tax=Nocardia sp. NBC_01388 TaxID=2903596 RepID=UPI002F916991